MKVWIRTIYRIDFRNGFTLSFCFLGGFLQVVVVMPYLSVDVGGVTLVWWWWWWWWW